MERSRMTGLRFEGVTVELGGRPVVDGVSWTAPRGQVTALLGPNGAGKSSCLRAALGLVPATGTIALDGADLLALPDRDRARRVAYVPQRTRLVAPLPVHRVVEQGRFAHRSALAGLAAEDRQAVARAMEITDIVGLSARPFTELSGGEQQRVMLARALATGAGTILVDEPTAALDVRHALGMLETLGRLARDGSCVLAVLHDLNEARAWADHAVLLDAGRVAAPGPVTEIVAAGPVRDVYGVELIEGGGLGFARREGGG